jgi:DNA-binding transcriptional ArsR family regulator
MARNPNPGAESARPVEGDADVAAVAALMADPSRAAVLVELADGRALPPSELAEVAGVSRSTISGHLAKLLDAGLLAVERGGRNRYYRLADPRVGEAVEALSALAPRKPVSSLRQSNRAGALGAARTCYGHLAGELGVGITEAMIARDYLEREAEVFLLTDPGAGFLADLGIPKPPRAGKTCNDWSERRPHLAGKLGVTLAKRLFELGWIERTDLRRAVRVTDEGARALHAHLGIDPPPARG